MTELQRSPSLEKDGAVHFEGAANEHAQFKLDAMEAEKAEADSTVLGALRNYPWACFWAFVMSFTIVCLSL
jgi:SP family general alpha glucoside:H+ symporter-like MFS transporter